MSEYNRFGFEWSTYDQIIPLYEKQFWAWVHPLQPADFAGKRVLDAGCGTGRNSLWPLQSGAAHVTAFDVDPRTTAVARKNLANQPRATVLEHSIYEIPFENEFDISMSIGVIHHLTDPRRAVAQLVKATKPGGTVLIWVYGQEGHATLKKTINAVRKMTSRMPLGLLNILVRPFSFLWWCFMRLAPSSDPYVRLLRKAPFWHIHSILFDQLLPETACYWSREEAISLFKDLPIGKVEAFFCNKCSWTVLTRKQG